jgi:radical SAM superfamily enzyme YgiQ (UPF0313 family)
MKNLIFITIPELDVAIPPPAAAALQPVVTSAGWGMKTVDLNLELQATLSVEEWRNLINFCELASDNIEDHLWDKIASICLQHVKAAIDKSTTVLAFSIFSIYSIRIARKILPLMRKEFPDLSVLCGGNALSSSIDSSSDIFGQTILDQGWAHNVIYGEGEIALKAFLAGDLSHPGINVPNNQQIANMDQLEFADYKGMQLDRYTGKRLLITGSRGCVRDCTFCDIATVWPKFRYRSADLLVEEMKRNFYDTGVSRFEFTDSLINGSTKNFRKFNELLYEAKQKDPGLSEITYSGQFICKQSNNMVPEVYELMHLAGCRQITVGIESFCEHIRFHMRKKFTNSDIDYHLEQCAKWAIPNVFLMIVGYPTETEADHAYTLECLRRYQRYGLMDIISYIRWGLTMHIYEDTPISKMMGDLGIDNGIHNIRDGLYAWHSTLNPTLTLEERIKRRLEVHEVSYDLGYKMPVVGTELMSLKALAQGRS